MRTVRVLAFLVVGLLACGDDGNKATDAGPGEDGRLGTMCDDGIDNDGDGKADYPADPGCVAPNADDETDDCPNGPRCPQCGNERDDDGNGVMDYPGDPGCESAADPLEVLTSPVACGATLMIKELPISGSDTGMLGGAGGASTSQITSPCGGGGGAAAFAYRLILTEPAVIVASTAGSQLDTVLDLRTSMCMDPGAEVACHDDVDTDDKTSRLTRSLAAGVYYLIVQGADTAATGTYTLTVEKFAGEGVACTDTAMCGPSLVCRTPLGGTGMICTQPQCGDTLDDDQDGKNGYPTDPGCQSPDDNDETDPSPLPACSDGIDNDNDQQTDYPDDTSCTSAGGNSEACSSEQDPINAITMGTTMGTLVGAHDDHDATCDDSFDGSGVDILYTLDVPHMRTLTIDTNNSTADTTLSLLRPTCMEPSIGCDDEGGSGTGDSLLTVTNLVAGSYIVAVDNYSADTSSFPNGAFNVHVTGVIMPGGRCDAQYTLGGALACPASNPCEGTAGNMKCRPTACGDGIDNDSDTKADFPLDPGCTAIDDTDEADSCASGPGPNCPQCADGIDNDGDNMTDSADPNCEFPSSPSESCMSVDPVITLTTATTAGDTTSSANDFAPSCGGSTNLAGDDVYAIAVPALTSLSIVADTDFDGAVALYNPTCGGMDLACGDFPESIQLGALAAGTYYFVVDGYSDDVFDVGEYSFTVNGTIADGASCESPLVAAGALHCALGSGCIGSAGARTCQPAQCSDGMDNDTDTLADYPFDPGCASPGDDDETNPGTAPVCSNGLDDDGGGGIDWPADYGCSSAAGTSEVFCAAETNPTSLITASPVMGTTAGATNDFAAQSCAFLDNSAGPDVALALSLPVAVTTLTLDLLDSTFDTQVSLRDTSCATELGCNEDEEINGLELQSYLELQDVVAGNYAVIIDGYNGQSGAYVLKVRGVVKPNASCASSLFMGGANAILVCPTGTTCNVGTMRCQ